MFENCGTSVIAAALDDIVCAKRTMQLIREIGIVGDGLYKALPPIRNPSFTSCKSDKGFWVKVICDNNYLGWFCFLSFSISYYFN